MAAAGCAVVTEVATGGWKKMFPGQKLLASCQPSQACRPPALQLWVSCVGLECAGCRGLRHIVGWYQTSTGVLAVDLGTADLEKPLSRGSSQVGDL